MLVLGEFYWHAKFPSRGELLLLHQPPVYFFSQTRERTCWGQLVSERRNLIFTRVRLDYRPKIAFLLCTLILSVVAKAILVPMAAFSSGGNDHYSYVLVFNHLPFFAAGMVL